MDPISQYRDGQRQVWEGFAAIEANTGMAAPALARFSGVETGSNLLDVGCGTGALALTAARAGARVTGIDITPTLIDRGIENAALMGVEIDWHVGDAEDLPFEDGAFDIVASQFGHMFAPRSDVAVVEMLRVVRPGGTIAFSTWPPDHFIGLGFRLSASYGPPLPDGITPPVAWGDPEFIGARLGDAVTDIEHAPGAILVPFLSPQHARLFYEANLGPITRLVDYLEDEPERLADYRRQHEQLIADFFEDNQLRQEFLMTRATKK